MIKMMMLLNAKEGMSADAFRDHYENVHVPLALALFPMFREYRRNYITPKASNPPGFDAIAEVWFDDAAALAAFRERASADEVRECIAKDEAMFLHPERKIFLVEEQVNRT